MIYNYYDFNYTMFLTLSILLEGIYKYYRDIDYLFNKFLLERYLYKIMYNKTINILNHFILIYHIQTIFDKIIHRDFCLKFLSCKKYMEK